MSYSWFQTSQQEVNGTVILPPLVFPDTVHIRHQCRKTIVLCCHRCLINTGVIKWTKFKYTLELWTPDVSKKEKMLVFKQLFSFFKVRCSIDIQKSHIFIVDRNRKGSFKNVPVRHQVERKIAREMKRSDVLQWPESYRRWKALEGKNMFVQKQTQMVGNWKKMIFNKSI